MAERELKPKNRWISPMAFFGKTLAKAKLTPALNPEPLPKQDLHDLLQCSTVESLAHAYKRNQWDKPSALHALEDLVKRHTHLINDIDPEQIRQCAQAMVQFGIEKQDYALFNLGLIFYKNAFTRGNETAFYDYKDLCGKFGLNAFVNDLTLSKGDIHLTNRYVAISQRQFEAFIQSLSVDSADNATLKSTTKTPKPSP